MDAETRKVSGAIAQAFDEARQSFGHREEIDRARDRLARIVLFRADQESCDVAVVNRRTLEAMAIYDHHRRVSAGSQARR